MAAERERLHPCGGRSVFGWEPPPRVSMSGQKKEASSRNTSPPTQTYGLPTRGMPDRIF